MERKERKIVLSAFVYNDLAEIHKFGLDTFGENLASHLLKDIYQQINELNLYYLIHPECRHLPTKTHIYRNIIFGNYLIIFRVKSEKIEVLRAIRGNLNPAKIKSIKKIKPK